MEILMIAPMILSVLTALGILIHQIHLKNCECFCVKSNCSKEQDDVSIDKIITT